MLNIQRIDNDANGFKIKMATVKPIIIWSRLFYK